MILVKLDKDELIRWAQGLRAIAMLSNSQRELGVIPYYETAIYPFAKLKEDYRNVTELIERYEEDD